MTLKQKCKPTVVYQVQTLEGFDQYTFEKDAEVEVPDDVAQIMLAKTKTNIYGQRCVKIVVSGSAEDTEWDAIVNDQSNSDQDYDFIDPLSHIIE